MINKTEFKEIRSDLDELDNKREHLIKKCRDILKQSKQAIYSVHRKELKKANALIAEIEKEIKDLNQIINKDQRLLSEGTYSAAMQEYVEAACYLGYLNDGEAVPIKRLKACSRDYLLGLCDLTGELVRFAVNCAIKGDVKEVEKIRGFVEELFGEFLQFDLRESELRRKVDSVKWNLKKIEEILYDLKKGGYIQKD